MNHSSDNQTVPAAMRRLIAAGGLLLLAVTWRLWTPQDLFPQVPFLHALGALPEWLEWCGCGLLVGGLGSALFAPAGSRTGRAGLLLFSIAMAFLILVDQHRLQPWAYQLSVAAIVLACVPDAFGLTLLRWFTVSIYLHSGLSKLDASFLETNGQHLVAALLEPLGLSMKFWSPEACRLAAALLPAGELLVACALCLPRFRRGGFYASLAMHAALLVALGPWGMNHKPAVLIWNVYFIAQNWLLFGRPGESPAANDAPAPSALHTVRRRLAAGLVAAVALLPFLEPRDRFDVWPSWAVYAAHPARARVYVHTAKVDRLPSSIRRHVAPAHPAAEWRRVSLAGWSLAALDVPIYPEDRFQLAAAIALARREGLEDGIRVVMESRADRWTAARTRRELIGQQALLRAARRFALNALPAGKPRLP